LKIHHRARNKVQNARGDVDQTTDDDNEPESLDSNGDVLEIDDDIQDCISILKLRS
jgi:hypothetical protein